MKKDERDAKIDELVALVATLEAVAKSAPSVSSVVVSITPPKFSVVPTLFPGVKGQDRLGGTYGARTHYIHRAMLAQYSRQGFIESRTIEAEATAIRTADFSLLGLPPVPVKAWAAHARDMLRNGKIVSAGRGIYVLTPLCIELMGGVIETATETATVSKTRKKS